MNRLDQFSTTLSDRWLQPQSMQLANVIQDDDALRNSFIDSLKNPVGFYPPLQESVFAGDRVAIVLQDGLPKARFLLECLISQLLETNIEPTDITVVVSPSMAKLFGLEFTPLDPEATEPVEAPVFYPMQNDFNAIGFRIHDSTDEQGVAYIAANAEGLPIKVNRAVVDADVILPIGFQQPVDTDGLADCIYPTFANQEAQARYRNRKNSVSDRQTEINLANEHLGSFFLIQIVGGPGGNICRTLSGERNAVVSSAQENVETTWRVEPVDEAEMAIVTIETEPDQQSWKDFARAVVAANSVANSSGPIFVWSELKEQPKSEVKKALNESFETGGKAKLSGLMQCLAGIVAERQVFLKSRLSQNLTEELGLGYVDSEADMSRLIDNQPSGVLLRDAHLCLLTPALENQDAN